MTAPKRDPTPPKEIDGAGDESSLAAAGTHKSNAAVNPTDPRWGDVLDCVMSCAGSKTCAWRPFYGRRHRDCS